MTPYFFQNSGKIVPFFYFFTTFHPVIPYFFIFLCFFVIHHCKNSLSSLHIFVHYCTFCASLHVKTCPDMTDCTLFTMAVVTSAEQSHIILTSPSKSCELKPLTTFLSLLYDFVDRDYYRC